VLGGKEEGREADAMVEGSQSVAIAREKGERSEDFEGGRRGGRREGNSEMERERRW
jgi:hypothetical protein